MDNALTKQALSCIRGGARDERPAMLFRTFAVYIKLDRTGWSVSYSSIDPIVDSWAGRHGLKLPTHDKRGAELTFRNVYTSSNEAECCQIWIDPPIDGMVGVHAASVESRDDEEMRQDWVVPVGELESALEIALAFARTWMAR